MITEAYVPQYFDQAYDINRVTTSTVNGQTVVKTKDMNIFDVFSDSSKSIGLFGSAGMNLFDLANFSASYTNMRSDTTELKSFSSYLSLNTDNIPKSALQWHITREIMMIIPLILKIHLPIQFLVIELVMR